MAEPRLLEGEALIHEGYLWIVKGYQHPPRGVIAFPRYNLVNRARASYARALNQLYYWSCLKMEVPVISADSLQLYSPRLSGPISYVVSVLREVLGFDDSYALSGSALLNDFDLARDLDVVIYGSREDYILSIERALKSELFKPLNYYSLYREYLEKHADRIDLHTYLNIKKKSILHFAFQGIHVNLKIVKFERGYRECVDPVHEREPFADRVELIDYIDKHVVPSKYLVEYRGSELYLESYRELYAELPRGVYYVRGSLERRRSGNYIVPDHGYIVYISGEG